MSNFIKTFITAKIGSPMNLCDDHFAYNLDKLSFAVSDGASCNLASRIYSRLLVDHFAEHGEGMFSDEICNEVCETWISETDEMINNQGNPYYLRNMFLKRKEAAATFVGMKMYKNKENEWMWDSYVLGDSVLIFIPEGESYPNILYTTNKGDFTPEFSTNIVFNNNPKSAHPYNSQLWRSQVWEARNQKLDKGTFVLMTDALAEWFLCPNYKSIQDKLSMLMNLESDKDFLEFVDRERSVCLNDNFYPLHDDDITLMILHIDNISTLSERNSIVEKTKSNYRHIIEQSAIDEICKSKKDLAEQYRLQVETNISLEGENSTLKEKTISLEGENRTLKEKTISLEGENRTLKEKTISLEGENSTLKEKTISLEEENRTFKGKTINLEEENRTLKEKTISLEEENRTLKEKISNIEENLRQKNEQLEWNQEQIEKNIGDIEKIKNEMKKKIEDDDKRQENIKEELENYKKKNDSLMKVYCQLRIMALVFGVVCFSILAIVVSLLIMARQLFC